MLLYLTSNENIGLFDFLMEESDMLMKKLSGEFSFKRFVINDMRSLDYFSYVVIDLEAIKEDDDGIVEAINAFKAIYDSKIIIFAEKASRILLDRIIDETETYNIITANTIERIKEEMRICISPQGMRKEYLMKALNFNTDIIDFPTFSFMEKDIKVVIAGSMSRVGTTTTAINLASYLSNIGAKVSYTEVNQSNHLKAIYSFFFSNIPIADGCFSGGMVDYFFDSRVPLNYNFNIIDIGVLDEKNKVIFKEIGDVQVLCGGIKPYEIDSLRDCMEKLKNIKNYHVLLPKGDMININNYIPDYENNMLHRIEHSKSLFSGDENKKTWELLLSEYIVRHKALKI